jgi:hypothetical protein
MGRESDQSLRMPRVGMNGVIPPLLYMFSWPGQSVVLLPVTELRVYCDTSVDSLSAVCPNIECGNHYTSSFITF